MVEQEKSKFELYGNCMVIHCGEDLDHHHAVELRDKSDRLIERGNVQNIVFDFQGVDFMDSSGIGFVMGRYRKVMFSGGKVALSGIGPAVDRIFGLSGLYNIMDKYDTVSDAIYGLKQPEAK